MLFRSEAEACQEVEDIEREPTVDPAEECPSEVDELFEVEVFAKLALCFYTLYEAEIVGTNIHFKLRDLESSHVQYLYMQ